MGISLSRLNVVVFSFAFLAAASGNSIANTNDLLIGEQWALENHAIAVSTQSSADVTGATCASTPTIEQDSYSCTDFTAAPVDDVDINLYQGWNLLTPSQNEIIIALIDTGIDYLHPDLKQKVWLNPGEALHADLNNNGIDDGCEDQIDLDNNGYLDDCHGINVQVERFVDTNQTQLNPAAGDPMDNATGHGTNMAGVMGAMANNRGDTFHGGIVGVTGLHNNIRILTCAAADLQFDAHPTVPGLGAPYGTHDDILECLNYFISLKQRGENIVVVNGSGGASELNNLYNILIPKASVNEKYLLNTPEISSAISELAELDINLVVAAGNNGWDIDALPGHAYFPAAFDHDNIISVAAINNQGERWQNSSYGRWSIDVFAPGESILSTMPRQVITQNPDLHDYVVSHGSSQATAFVSGMIALARDNATTQSLTASDLRRLIISSGKALGNQESASVSGKLARLVDNNQSGFLNCEDQNFQRRQWPQKNELLKLPGEWVTLEIAHYNCHQPGSEQALEVTITQTGETIQLTDNGIFPDQAAQDGIYSAQWQVPNSHDAYDISFGIDSVTTQTDSIRINTTIIVDNLASNTRRTGSWWPSIFRPNFYNTNYRYAFDSNERSFTWSPKVPRAGFYQVQATWPSYSGFTQHAEYSIQHGNLSSPDTALAIANQSQGGGQWHSLGVYWFDEGDYDITLSNDNITAAVIADAIRLKPMATQ